MDGWMGHICSVSEVLGREQESAFIWAAIFRNRVMLLILYRFLFFFLCCVMLFLRDR